MKHLKQHFHTVKWLQNSTKSCEKLWLNILRKHLHSQCYHSPLTLSRTSDHHQMKKSTLKAGSKQTLIHNEVSHTKHPSHIKKVKMWHTSYQINYHQCFPWGFTKVTPVSQNSLIFKSSCQLLLRVDFCFKAVISNNQNHSFEAMLQRNVSKRWKEEHLKLPSPTMNSGYIHIWKVLIITEGKGV